MKISPHDNQFNAHNASHHETSGIDAHDLPRLPRETIPREAVASDSITRHSATTPEENAAAISKSAIVALLFMGALLTLGLFGIYSNKRNSAPLVTSGITNRVLEVKPVIVHVAGAVKKPGVYTLKSGARIDDALQKAGGALGQADAHALNLAALAQDGTKIEVPFKAKLPSRIATKPALAQNFDNDVVSNSAADLPTKITPDISTNYSRDIAPTEIAKSEAEVAAVPFASAKAAARKPAPRVASNISSTRTSSRSAKPLSTTKPKTLRKPRAKKEKSKTIAGLPRALTPSGELSDNASPQFLAKNPLDLNRITAEQLEALPGVGPSLATRVLAYRKENGGFKSVDELDNVKGIGEKKLEDLRPLLRVEGEVQAAAPSEN